MSPNDIALLVIGLISVFGLAGILVHAAWRADHPKPDRHRASR